MYVNANETIGMTDSMTINNAVKKAKETGHNKVLIPKENMRTNSDCWIIEEAIALPSDIEILLDGAHLILADDVYTPVFVTENFLERKIYDMENITIHGKNGAVLDGGNYNGLCEANSLKAGRPHVALNTTCLFCHTKNLTFSDLKIVNYRSWGITNAFVTHSQFRNIEFKADSSYRDEKGVRHTDRLPRNYDEIYIKNASGIGLRLGCNNITIENVTGFTSDDTIVLSTVHGTLFVYYAFLAETGKKADIYNIEIKDIMSDAFTTSNIRILHEDRYKIHDVYIDGVKDLREDNRYCAKATVRIGDMIYGKVSSTFGDAYNIIIKNVSSKARAGVSVCKSLKDSIIENIEYHGEGVPFALLQKCDIENLSLRNIFKNSETTFYETSDIYKNIFNYDER